jgi:predicted kinase
VSITQLTLIRGLPGSGKSTLAKTIEAIHLGADMYFVDGKGNYNFDRTLLKKAHFWCQKKCKQALIEGQSVVVSNTFIKQWEMEPYRVLARKYQAILDIRVCTGNYKTIHDVPRNTIIKMQQQWED